MRTLVLVALVGCASHAPGGASSPDAGLPAVGAPLAPLPQPAGCTQHVALTAANGMQALGPFALDAAGVSLCLHLDTTGFVHPHGAIETGRSAGDAAPYALTLEDTTLAPTTQGWDVTIGGTPDASFENLEWDPPVSTTFDLVVWARATAVSAPTYVTIDVIEPYE
jgi:hypothetical protein